MKKSILFASLFLACLSPASAAKWDPISPEEFATNRSAIEPEANVETIFNDVTVAQYFVDWQISTRYDIHIRVKVFDEIGVEEMTQMEIPLYDGTRLTQLDARTVKPDGTYVEIDKSSIFDTEVERSSRGKVKAKGFAFPALEPGDIVEVKVELKRRGGNWAVQFSFDSEYPSRRSTFRVKPAEQPSKGLFTHRIVWMNFPEAEGKSKGGFFEFERLNERAYSNEPYRVPDFHTRPTVVMFYVYEEPPRPKDYWKETAKSLFRDMKSKIKSTKMVSDAAEGLVSGASEDEEKLRRLYDYCVTEIQNRTYHFNTLTETELEDMKDNDSPNHTLERGSGTPGDIRRLFAAMAGGFGFDVRMARVSNKSDVLFAPNLKFPFVLNDEVVAIEIGKEWKFFDPGNPMLPFGSVNWWNSENAALLADSKNERFERIPQVPASESVMTRSGELKVDENGTLSGRITQSYVGYEAVDIRLDLEEMNTEESEKLIRDRVTEALPRAKLENIVFENQRDPYKPMLVSYDLEVPEYADVVGDRMFVQPSVFEKGQDPMFQDEKPRETDIMFGYAWTSRDDLKITLPDGYEIESGQAPEPFAIEKVLSFEATVKLSKKYPVIQYDRKFVMERTALAAKAGELLKRVFANLQVQDGYAVTFKKSAAAGTAAN